MRRPHLPVVSQGGSEAFVIGLYSIHLITLPFWPGIRLPP